MSRLMLFPDANTERAAVDAWFAARPAPLRALGAAWFERLRACGSDVRELLHDQHPTACVGAAAFCYVNVFTAHVNIGFFLGAGLADPAGLLEGSGKFMRHVKLFPGRPLPEAALEALVRAAYVDMRARYRQHQQLSQAQTRAPGP